MASIFKAANGKWRAQVRRKGQKSVSEYFLTRLEAQKWARAVESDMDRGKRTPTGLHTTLADILQAYRAAHGEAFKETKDRALALIEHRLGHLRLDELTKAQISEFFEIRNREGAGSTTNKQTFSYLRTVLKYGGARFDADEAVAQALTRMELLWAAMTHSGQLTDSAQRTRRPTEDELTRMFDWFDTRPRSALPMTDLTLFAICTAMRQGEIMGPDGCVYEHLDYGNRTLHIRGRKDPTARSGRDMTIPLLAGHVTIAGKDHDPVEIIQRQRTARMNKGRIFPFATEALQSAWSACLRACDIKDLRFHDLRHDGISRMFEAGYDIPQVAAVSGHKSWKNLQRYTNLWPDKVKASKGDIKLS